MSVKIMSMVFDRYQKGGGEMLLALSLADFADDNGENIFPSIRQLAEKTRQSERTVQYQLRRMEKSGWLILVNSGNGGRNQRREYIICPDWIKGANVAPPVKGAIDDMKGCNPRHKRVQPVAPAYNRHRTIKEPSKNHRAREAPRKVSVEDLVDEGVSEQVAAEFIALRKRKRSELTPLALAGIEREARKANISLQDAMLECVERGWQGFKASWLEQGKVRQSKRDEKFDPVAYVNRNRISRQRRKEEEFDVIDC